jgi:predicted PurR-regulated permease PerM
MENGLGSGVLDRGLNLSPLVTILSPFLPAWVPGPTGAILAVSLKMAAIKLFPQGSSATGWLLALGMTEYALSLQPRVSATSVHRGIR